VQNQIADPHLVGKEAEYEGIGSRKSVSEEELVEKKSS